MTTLKLNIKVPEIYQNELSSNPAIIESGVIFSVSISETFLENVSQKRSFAMQKRLLCSSCNLRRPHFVANKIML